jgi:hypothetical protein
MIGRVVTPLRLFQFVCLLLVGAAFFVLRHECLQEAGAVCLAVVTEPIARIVQFGTFILNRHWDYAYYEMAAAGVGVVLVLLTLLWKRSLAWWCLFYLVALTLTSLGELSALNRNKIHTLLYDGGAFIAALLAFFLLLRLYP